MTMGCTARRAWSTLLRDRRLADLSVVSAFAGASTGLAGNDGCARALTAAKVRRRYGPRWRSASRRRLGDAAAIGYAGALKLVAGSTGRNTSAT